MTFTPAQLQNETAAHWFCLKAQPKHEHLAAQSLRKLLGLECFAPRIRFRKKTQRGMVWFVEALFPGYLFARFVFAENHRNVQYAPGVSTIVRFGEWISAIEDTTIEQLRLASSGDNEVVVVDPEPKIGDAVQIAGGALQGLEAVVTQVLPARQRVKVLLEFLGQTIEAEIAAPKIISNTPIRASTALGHGVAP